MAFSNPLMRRLPMAAAALAAASLHPTATLHAESATNYIPFRKPIYDDFSSLSRRRPARRPDTTQSSHPNSPTLTDRFAAHIRRGRLFVYAHVSVAEEGLNTLISSFLAHERSFTSAIASLAPAPESRELLLPGSLYVFVAAMAGSIVSRNRNMLLRAAVPAAIGLGAALVVLPTTMRNVGDLIWTYEEKVPVMSENHLRLRGMAEEGIRESKKTYINAQGLIEEGIRAAHETIERLVRNGK